MNACPEITTITLSVDSITVVISIVYTYNVLGYLGYEICYTEHKREINFQIIEENRRLNKTTRMNTIPEECEACVS